MKKKMMLGVLCLMMAFSATGSVYAQQEEVTEETKISEDWKSYQMKIGEEIYSFPMTAETWASYEGWETKDDLTQLLNPGQYTMVYYTKDNVKMVVYVMNFGNNSEPIENGCIVGAGVDSFYWPIEALEVTLPGDLVRGQADEESIKKSYGEPSDVYEGDLYTKYTYKTDSYSSIELKTSTETGKLEDITMRNFVEPEGFEAGEINEEVSEAIKNYKKPESLGDDLKQYEIEVDGNCYQMPVPVQTLLEDGWQIDETSTDEYVKAHASGWCELRQGGQSFRTMVRNPEEGATKAENCWIEELSTGGYGLSFDGSLPCGIKTGMQEADMLQILEEQQIRYEKEESSSFCYYTFNKEAYNQCYKVTVYTGDDGSFEKNSIMEISCSNTIE